MLAELFKQVVFDRVDLWNDRMPECKVEASSFRVPYSDVTYSEVPIFRYVEAISLCDCQSHRHICVLLNEYHSGHDLLDAIVDKLENYFGVEESTDAKGENMPIKSLDLNHLAYAVVNDLENNFCVDENTDEKGEDILYMPIKLSEPETLYMRLDSKTVAELYAGLFGPEWKKWKAKIDRVIFNDPATIILWKDGAKTVVKCGPNDTYDKEKGLAMALCKYVLGNSGNFNQFFKTFMEVED